MSFETSQYSDEVLQKLAELRWQRQMIERSVYCSQITAETLEQILEILFHVDREVEALEDVRRMN